VLFGLPGAIGVTFSMPIGDAISGALTLGSVAGFLSHTYVTWLPYKMVREPNFKVPAAIASYFLWGVIIGPIIHSIVIPGWLDFTHVLPPAVAWGAVTPAILINHGLTAATLFCFVGFIEQRTNGLRGVDDFGGLRKVAPVLCGLMGISLFSSLGLPGLNGFVGEFLIFKGVLPLAAWGASVSVLGLLLTAVFILTVAQRVFHGPLNGKWSGLGDLTIGERAIVVPAIVLMFVLGIYPQLAIGAVNATVVELVAQLKF